MMFPHYIPEDLNVELLMSYLSNGSFSITFKGHHCRNAYNDILEIENGTDDAVNISIARNSIYNSLPEYLFHPIDRFSNLPYLEEKERFAEELGKQEWEKENAFRFFAPVDLQLLKYRQMVREELRGVSESNTLLIDILGDRLTEEQRNNRFIAKTQPYLLSCKTIRGDKTLLSFMLRKVFMDEGITITPVVCSKAFKDSAPRYTDHMDDVLDATYVGNVFDETVIVYNVYYWPETVDADFLTIVDEIEEYRLFIQDYFLSIEETLQFDISCDERGLRLSDNQSFYYLNYNTNI